MKVQNQPESKRRNRILKLRKYQRRDKPALGISGSLMLQLFDSWHYHDKLESAHELVLDTNEFSLAWNITHAMLTEPKDFKLRLLQRPSLSQQPEPWQEQMDQEPAQPQEQKEQGQVKSVEISLESLNLICFHEPTIRKLMLNHDKAIIFQNIDIQVYVMEELKSEGFRVHFQDKQKTKVSITYEQFLKFIEALPRVTKSIMKYKKRYDTEEWIQKATGLIKQVRGVMYKSS